MVIPGSIEALEEALVRCCDLEWRSPSVRAGSPWAKDGPWSLAQGEVGDVKGDWSTTLLVNEAGRELEVRKVDSRRPRTSLNCTDVAEYERTLGWFGLVGDDMVRKAIWLACWQIWRGEASSLMPGGRVAWKQVAKDVRSDMRPESLGGACRRELAKLVCRLNGWPANRARILLGARYGLADEQAGRAAFVVLDDRP